VEGEGSFDPLHHCARAGPSRSPGERQQRCMHVCVASEACLFPPHNTCTPQDMQAAADAKAELGAAESAAVVAADAAAAAAAAAQSAVVAAQAAAAAQCLEDA
jgi:hypothetical protein